MLQQLLCWSVSNCPGVEGSVHVRCIVGNCLKVKGSVHVICIDLCPRVHKSLNIRIYWFVASNIILQGWVCFCWIYKFLGNCLIFIVIEFKGLFIKF